MQSMRLETGGGILDSGVATARKWGRIAYHMNPQRNMRYYELDPLQLRRTI